MTKLGLMCLALLVAVICLADSDGTLDRLATDLTKDYVQFVYPGPISVNMGLKILRFSYDAKTKVLTSQVWEHMTWSDSRLKWNPSEYSNISFIRLPSNMVWKPDIVLYNALEYKERQNVNVVIASDGIVSWVPPNVYRTSCKTIHRTSQIFCLYKLGSWVYDVNDLNLTMHTDQFLDFDSYNANQYYDVVNYTASRNVVHYECCPEAYVDISAEIILSSRKAATSGVLVANP